MAFAISVGALLLLRGWSRSVDVADSLPPNLTTYIYTTNWNQRPSSYVPVLPPESLQPSCWRFWASGQLRRTLRRARCRVDPPTSCHDEPVAHRRRLSGDDSARRWELRCGL